MQTLAIAIGAAFASFVLSAFAIPNTTGRSKKTAYIIFITGICYFSCILSVQQVQTQNMTELQRIFDTNRELQKQIHAYEDNIPKYRFEFNNTSECETSLAMCAGQVKLHDEIFSRYWGLPNETSIRMKADRERRRYRYRGPDSAAAKWWKELPLGVRREMERLQNSTENLEAMLWEKMRPAQ